MDFSDEFYEQRPDEEESQFKYKTLHILKKKIKKILNVCSFGNPTVQKTFFISFMLLFSIITPLIIVLYYPLQVEWPDVGVCSISTDKRIPCLVDRAHLNRALCVENDCCWDTDDLEDETLRCYQREPSSQNYNIKGLNWTESQVTFFLTHILKVKPFGQTIEDAKLILTEVNQNHLRFQLTKDDSESNAGLPLAAPPAEQFENIVHLPNLNKTTKFSLEVVDKHNNKSFALALTRGAFIVTNQFIEMTVSFPKDLRVFGLSLPRKKLFHEFTGQTVTIFSNSSKSFFSSHPVLLFMNATSGSTHALLLKDPHLMRVTFHNSPAIIFRTAARSLDLHMFFGSTPVEVIEHLHNVIEKPLLPPYWALGAHFCFLNDNPKDVKTVYEEFSKANIYSESVCLGPDTWNKFILNPDQWNSKDYYTGNGKKLLMIMNPQVPTNISKTQFSISYQKGKAKNIFFKNPNQTVYIGKFLNISVAYPDFSYSTTREWLEELLFRLNINGSFLHWNSPFDVGDRNATPCVWDPKQLSFMPNMNLTLLLANTPCANITSPNNQSHLDLHNTYGHSHLKVTSGILRKLTRQRPFVLSLSTSIGSGAWGGQWIANPSATWEDLQQTFVQIMDSSLAGLPLTGSSVCGYGNFTNDNLCIHWLQLAFFSPLTFTITKFNNPETYVQSFGKGLLKLIKSLTVYRYSFLPYFYTQLYAAHIKGTPAIRPLFFEFPKDRNVFTDGGSSFLWGEALMVSIVLEDEVYASVYFPDAAWYDFYTGAKKPFRKKLADIPAPRYYVNLHVRGGSIIAVRNVETENNLSTTSSQKRNFILIVALNPDTGTAKGSLYLDDGTTYFEPEKSNEMPRLQVSFTVDNNGNSSTLTIETTDASSALDVGERFRNLSISTTVEKIKIWGINRTETVLFNDVILTDGCEYKDHILTIDYEFEIYEKTMVTWILKPKT